MCTVENPQSIVVCDVAIGHVREALAEHFAAGVSYSVAEGKGTRVQADPSVDGQQFTEVVQRAIAAAQSTEQA